MVFCASILDRPVWAPVAPLLLASRGQPRWEKTRLSSHDLAVRIVPAHLPLGAQDHQDSPDAVFRFLLVAPTDVGQAATANKLRRLAQRKTGLGGAVLFLFPRGDSDRQRGLGHVAAYKQLQQECAMLCDVLVLVLRESRG